MTRLEAHHSVFKLDVEVTFEDHEELVGVVVLVPVEVAFKDAEAHPGVVDGAERPVSPRRVGGADGADIHVLAAHEQNLVG
ncbi:MAG: hypothetical protein U5J99_03545 [Parvularculaceae bacterium]|nr:hypothetical protein [Parvularculaceae bacterium]